MDIPEIITTERLILQRPVVSMELAREIHTAVMASLKNLEQWLPWAKPTYTLDDEVKYLTENCDKGWKEKTNFAYIIRTKSDGRFLGVIDFIKIDEKNKSTEIGFWLQDNAVGNGYMVEAVLGLEKAAFAAGCERVEIENDARNIRSVNVAKRAGYHLDGIMRHQKWSDYDNMFIDINVWSKLKNEQ